VEHSGKRAVVALALGAAVAACATNPPPSPTSQASRAPASSVPRVVVTNRGTEPAVLLVQGDAGAARYMVAAGSAATVRDPAAVGLVERLRALHVDCEGYYTAINDSEGDWQVVLMDETGNMLDLSDGPVPSAPLAAPTAACPNSHQ
jgi:hypothetical protein